MADIVKTKAGKSGDRTAVHIDGSKNSTFYNMDKNKNLEVQYDNIFERKGKEKNNNIGARIFAVDFCLDPTNIGLEEKELERQRNINILKIF